ncbi:MAG: ABC transporter ATP-binding protein [Ruminococcaceae bacterium]|nr:ABC transporter ATP-binding protein [Oscillospiraceae bacterium]
MQPILDIRGFSKSYDGKVMAVENLSLTIEPGDIYGFIGKNGAGKTTTLRAAAGILRFDIGDMLVDGTSIKADPLACKRKIAYIPDNPDLYEFLTGRQYLDFVADLFEIAGDERGQRIEHYARALDLSDRLHDLISSYSHGMKQKLAMIGGFIHRPVLFLMDEPFVGLDPEAVVRVRQIIRDFCAQGSAVFFSTHVLEVAEKLCNKVAVIKDGRLVAAGATDQVRGQASLEEYFLEAMRDA